MGHLAAKANVVAKLKTAALARVAAKLVADASAPQAKDPTDVPSHTANIRIDEALPRTHSGTNIT